MWIEYQEWMDQATGNVVCQAYAVDANGVGRGLRCAISAETLFESGTLDGRLSKKIHQWFRDRCNQGMPTLAHGFVYEAPTEDALVAYIWADEIVSIQSET